MSGQLNHRNRVVAVISSFQPSEDLIQHCAQLAPQVRQIIVVDDGSDDRADVVLSQLTSANVQVLKLGQNMGLGAAMNAGFEGTRKLTPDFVLTFDQDSAVPDGFVDLLVNECDRLTATGVRVGMICPGFYGATPQFSEHANAQFTPAIAPIQSGSLMPLSVIDSLGPQRDDFFIDLIDTEYFYRMKQAGFEAVAVPDLQLPHGFGHRLFVHAFGRRLTKRDARPRMVAVSSPFRYYYRARNRILLNREYKDVPTLRRELRSQARNDLFLDFGVALYSARGRFALLRLMLAGWRDGLRGITGKMPTELAHLAQRVSWKHPVDTD